MNSSDDRVVRASAPGPFDSESGKINGYKIAVHSFPARRLAFEGQREGQAGKFTCAVGKGRQLAKFFYLWEADRWLAIPKRVRYSAWFTFS